MIIREWNKDSKPTKPFCIVYVSSDDKLAVWQHYPHTSSSRYEWSVEVLGWFYIDDL